MSILSKKVQALAQFEDCNSSDIEPHTDNRFRVLGTSSEYLVLTEREAEREAGVQILASAWAFNADFIREHAGLPEEADEMIKGFCEAKCENANPTIIAMLKDMDQFIQDAIAANGRGHFLSSYDGEENKVKIDGIVYCIYRIN